MPSNPGTMRTLLLGICIAIASMLHAQRYCGSTDYLSQQKSLDPSLISRINAAEDFISHQLSLKAKTEEENVRIIRIPVVVHIIYNTAAQNISDAQVQSQLDVLNRDFRRMNADTANTPLRFRQLAADVQIEFVLATADPEGRPTNGIVRKQSSVPYWGNDDRIKYTANGGDNAWDSKSYLNIWVGHLRSLLGYSSVIGSLPEKDGVVVNYTAFGTINTSQPYHLGRTAVHEVGHWLGLRHIWGDTYCGDDGIDDTPKQGNFTAGCPGGIRSSCTNGANGDMYMNFMDYTDDACVNLFTTGQKNRMLASFNEGGPRYSLTASKGLLQPWNEPAPAPLPEITQPAFSFYPNPAQEQLVLQFPPDFTGIGKPVSVINMSGTEVFTTTVVSKDMKLNLQRLQPGMYVIRIGAGKEMISEKFVKL